MLNIRKCDCSDWESTHSEQNRLLSLFDHHLPVVPCETASMLPFLTTSSRGMEMRLVAGRVLLPIQQSEVASDSVVWPSTKSSISSQISSAKNPEPIRPEIYRKRHFLSRHPAKSASPMNLSRRSPQ